MLAPDLRLVFCGINPGRASATAGAHYANPRNDFWRLLHDAGFTPRLYDPSEQHELLELGYRTHERRVPHDPRLGRSARRRLRGIGRAARGAVALDLRPGVIAFVGKAGYQGAFRERPELGLQDRRLGDTPPLRPALHVARERGRPVRGAPALVPALAELATDR